VTARTIVVVSAGISRPSATRLLADQIAAAVQDALARDGDEVTLEVFELRDLAQDLTNNVLTGFPGEHLASVLASASAADALIVVTPIFSASYSGLFKLFFDVLDKDAIAGKPILMAATGGTSRHSLALEFAIRPMLAYHRAVVVPTGVFAATEDWGSTGAGDALRGRVRRAADELAGLLRHAPSSAPADPFDDITPFDQLLRGR
jgi:FMN reductase